MHDMTTACDMAHSVAPPPPPSQKKPLSCLTAWRQTLMKLLRWPSLRMLETPCCLATFWRISRRLSLGSETRRDRNYRATVVILHTVTHQARDSRVKCWLRKTEIQLHTPASRSVKEERVSNTNSPFLLVNQISTETCWQTPFVPYTFPHTHFFFCVFNSGTLIASREHLRYYVDDSCCTMTSVAAMLQRRGMNDLGVNQKWVF